MISKRMKNNIKNYKLLKNKLTYEECVEFINKYDDVSDVFLYVVEDMYNHNRHLNEVTIEEIKDFYYELSVEKIKKHVGYIKKLYDKFTLNELNDISDLICNERNNEAHIVEDFSDFIDE